MVFRAPALSREANAVIGWLMVGVIVIGATGSFHTGAVLWGGFSLVVAVAAVIPALSTGEWVAMVPWPLLSVAAVATLARTARVYPEPMGYLALATLAIIVVVELVAFTSVELSQGFAIGFGVLTTLALEALWIVAQFYSDVWLGTEFLTTQAALQKDIVTVTAVGFAVGGLFLTLFERFEPADPVDRSAEDGWSG